MSTFDNDTSSNGSVSDEAEGTALIGNQKNRDDNFEFQLAQDDYDPSSTGNLSNSSNMESHSSGNPFIPQLDFSPSLQDFTSRKKELHNIFEKFADSTMLDIRRLDIRIEKRNKKLSTYNTPGTDLPSAFKQFFNADFNPTTISDSGVFPETDTYVDRGNQLINTFKSEMSSLILDWMEKEREHLVSLRTELLSKFQNEAQVLLQAELLKCSVADRSTLATYVQKLLQSKINSRAEVLNKVKADPLAFSTQVESATGSSTKRSRLENSTSDDDVKNVGATENSRNSNVVKSQNRQGRGNQSGRGQQTTQRPHPNQHFNKGKGGSAPQNTKGNDNRGGQKTTKR